MIKTITLEWLQSEGACKESLEAWQKETDHDTFATLNRLIDKNPKWGNWLVCRLMTKKQAVKYAVFAAEQVIDIYEKAYPDDKRPRNAIEAAKAYLKNPSKKTKAAAANAASAASAAAYAAYAAADAAASAAADAAADAAAYAAAYASTSAYAAASATSAASAAADAAADAAAYAAYADAAAYERRKMKAKILKYGIRLLEQS